MSKDKVSKSTTIRQFLFGDFDRDGVKNVDDPYPFDYNRSQWPSIQKNPEYYQKARYGGSEVKLSKELQAIERYNNSHRQLVKSVMQDYPESYGRIKTIPSTIRKLRKHYIKDVSDIGGVTVITDKREDIYRKAEEVRGKYREDREELDDFYSKPTKKVYYAYHMGIRGPRKELVEVQLKTEQMRKLHVEMHEPYKMGKTLKPYIPKAKELYEKGY